jgi:hypothetical protein
MEKRNDYADFRTEVSTSVTDLFRSKLCLTLLLVRRFRRCRSIAQENLGKPKKTKSISRLECAILNDAAPNPVRGHGAILTCQRRVGPQLRSNVPATPARRPIRPTLEPVPVQRET